MSSENADQQQSAINRRKLTLEHLSARHQQLKQQKQQLKSDEISKLEDADESSLKKSELVENGNKNELPDSSCFLVHFKGQILGANFQGIDHIYCRFSWIHGSDWQILGGETESGYSQIASRNRLTSKKLYLNEFSTSNRASSGKLNLGDNLDFVWNLPIECTFSSSNVYGWPQLAVSVYGLNFLGLDVIRGYGHLHLPPIPGRHELSIDLFRPKSSTLLGEISCYLGGKRPEFLDFKVVAEGQGRDVLRFSSEKGQVIVQIDVIIKDLVKHGYMYN